MKPTLDLTAEEIEAVSIKTKYCVDKKIHDLNVRSSIARGYGSIPVASPDFKQSDPIAIICSGPSLRDSWEEAKEFKVILTCSGAHDFMIERGIIPKFHMETDPRPHKSVFTKNARKDITYLIASNCHPDVFNNLEGCDVKLWHVTGNPAHHVPRGHWQITGGCNVGLRAMVVARLMGYRHIHIWGMDCSADKEAMFHANFHPNEPKTKQHRIVKVGGREFFSSDVFIECARQFFKETMLLSDARVTLHGDGLLQALAIQKMADPKEIEKRKEFIQKRGGAAVIAIGMPNTISQDYIELNRKLHHDNYNYGGHGDRYAKIVKKLVEKQKIKSVLDYGCGKGALAEALDFPIWEYDPCIEGKEAPPRPADLVVCTDVLEHIEPDHLPGVLEDLKRVVKLTGFFAIHTGQSCKTLADGRNTHLIQQGLEAWRETLSKYFNIAFCSEVKGTPIIYVIVMPKIGMVAKAA